MDNRNIKVSIYHKNPMFRKIPSSYTITVLYLKEDSILLKIGKNGKLSTDYIDVGNGDFHKKITLNMIKRSELDVSELYCSNGLNYIALIKSNKYFWSHLVNYLLGNKWKEYKIKDLKNLNNVYNKEKIINMLEDYEKGEYVKTNMSNIFFDI